MAERDFKRLLRAQQAGDGAINQGAGHISSGENTVKMPAGDKEFAKLLQSAGDSKFSY